MLLLVDNRFLLFSFYALAYALNRVLVLTHQDNSVCKERFFRGVTFATIEQIVVTVIIFDVFGNTGNGLFQDFFNRLYRLSPSLNV